VQTKKFGEVMDENPEVFDPKEWHAEQLTLAMFILLERVLLGDKSDFWPYLEILPEIDFFCDWPLADIEACQDAKLVKTTSEFKIDIDLQWSYISSILEKNAAWFSQLQDCSKQFRRAYAQVCSRCFSIDFSGPTMIPFADLCNHNHVQNSNLLMNKTLHLNPLSVPGYYSKDLYLADLRMCYSLEEQGQLDVGKVRGFDSGETGFVEGVRERSYEGWLEHMADWEHEEVETKKE